MTQGSEGAAGAIVTAFAAQGDLVSRIALALASPEPFAAQVQQALREMGEFLQVSRSYVFIDNDRGTTTSCTHEWCAPRISAEQANLQAIPYATIPSFRAMLLADGRIAAEDAARLPADVRAVLEPQGIRALLIYALPIQGSVRGFVGFDDCTRQRPWTAAEDAVLRAASGVLAVAFARQLAQARTLSSEANFRSFFSSLGDYLVVADLAGCVLHANDALERALGYSQEELLGMPLRELHPADKRAEADELLGRVLAGACAACPLELQAKDGRRIPVETRVWFGRWDGRDCLFGRSVDITERRRAAEERAKLEEQLRQSQKLESVGQLAGGVAHDFNNMLQAILGNVELALDDAPFGTSLRASLDEIHRCATRSAGLTRQLLAFARKQVIAPKVLDLNATVGGMLQMLHRLLGEGARLDWHPNADLWHVRMDDSQLAQVLVNLCVNARDALGGHGTIVIATQNECVERGIDPDTKPGDYVRLSVSDDGCGMNRDVLEHVFEPFFTTKGQGKGTGLGLATVYGIVRQNGGFIDVTSAPGRGSSFAVYLPRHAAPLSHAGLDAPESVRRGRASETILLVEDEPGILSMVRAMLQRGGYTVLSTPRPREALTLAHHHPGTIHLLLSDVVMPEMDGRELARRLIASFPSMRRLFMSGHTSDVVADRGVVEGGVGFLRKPFTSAQLFDAVRRTLTPS